MTTYSVHAELCRATRSMMASGRGSALWPVAASTCHAVAPDATRSLCGKLSTAWTQVSDDWAAHDAGPQRGLLCRKCRAAMLAAEPAALS